MKPYPCSFDIGGSASFCVYVKLSIPLVALRNGFRFCPLSVVPVLSIKRSWSAGGTTAALFTGTNSCGEGMICVIFSK